MIRSTTGRGPARRSHLSGSTNPDGPHLGAGTQLEASLERLGVVLAGQVGRRLTELGAAVGQDRGTLRHSHRHGSQLTEQVQESFIPDS